MALILNLKMGHVSPQFHVKFNDFFETVGKDTNNPCHTENPKMALPKWVSIKARQVTQKGAPNATIDTLRAKNQ